MAKPEFEAIRNEDGTYTVRFGGATVYVEDDNALLEIIRAMEI